MSHGTVTLMWTSSSLTAPEPDHIVLLVSCQPSTGLFPRNGHPVEGCTAEETLDKLTVEPDAEEPKRKRKRRRRRAVHVSTRQDDLNPQDSVEPADNHDTHVQGLSSKRPKNASSKRPTKRLSINGLSSKSLSSKRLVIETSAPPHNYRPIYLYCIAIKQGSQVCK